VPGDLHSHRVKVEGMEAAKTERKGRESVRITDLLDHQAINVDLGATDKEGVIRELVHSLSTCGAIEAAEEEALVSILMTREAASSTGIGDGIGFPHGKCAGLREIVGAFGLSRAGIDFDAADGKPVHLFFLLVAPEDSAGPHLKALARLSKIIKDRSVRNSLRAAKDDEQVVRILQEQERKTP